MGFFNKALSISPSDYDALMGKGEALIQLMRYDEALEVFNKVCLVYPGNSQSYYKKAVIRVQQGNYTQALSEVDQAIKRAERAFPLWEMRAAILRKLGRTAAAEESEAMAQRYDPRRHVGL
jgi:tetratricopeptide (TPR) repeat protein